MKFRIFVVDDDRHYARLISYRLEKNEEQDVHVFSSGEELIENLKDDPDLVLLDLRMPVMSGYEVIEAMQADPTLQNIPVLLLTSVTYVDNATEYRGDRITLQRRGGLSPLDSLRYLRGLLNTLTPTRP